METFYMVTILLLGFMLIYMLVKGQLNKALEEKIHQLYTEKVESDIQDIYREFESYSAIIDSRINRLKVLTERQEANVTAWENIRNEIQKSKTGKEVLKYLENNQDIHKTSDQIKNEIIQLKDEITRDLKSYLAGKLKLDENIPVTNPPKSANIKRENVKTKQITPPPLKINMQDTDEDLNLAELIVDDMLKTQPDNSLLKPSLKPEKEKTKASTVSEADITDQDNKFIDTLASIGKTLSPIFFKPSKPQPVQAQTKPAQERKKDNFNTLITKEASAAPVKTKPVPEKETINTPVETPDEKVTLGSSLAPDQLLKLIDSLKVSKSRPDALKNLLAKGFDLSQIAELSSIPYSDLELTKNLYNIE